MTGENPITPSGNQQPQKAAAPKAQDALMPPPAPSAPAGVPAISAAPQPVPKPAPANDAAIFGGNAAGSDPLEIGEGIVIEQQPQREAVVEDMNAALGGNSRIVSEGATPAVSPLHNEGALPRVRTYKDDLASAVKRRQISVVGMIAAEQDRGRKSPAQIDTRPTVDWRKRLLIVGAIVLIVGGIGAAAAAYLLSRPSESQQGSQALPPLIFSDTAVTFAVDADTQAGNLLPSLVKTRNAAQLSLGEVEQVRLVDQTGAEISSQSFLANIAAAVSGPFSRALGTRMMLGLHAFDRTQPFLIFTVTDYERAFSGMLEWESRLSRDLDPLFAPQTALLGGAVQGSALQFEDKVVKNVNARILLREDGTPRLIYAFPRKDMLVIATNESTLREVLTRLAQTAAQ